MPKKELKRTHYYSMKRLPPKDANEPADYTVILHTPDGGSELVDTLSKRHTKATEMPFIKNEAIRERWKKINAKRIRSRPRNKYGPMVWTSQKFNGITAATLRKAYDKSVVSHIKQVRDDNINTKSDTSSSESL